MFSLSCSRAKEVTPAQQTGKPEAKPAQSAPNASAHHGIAWYEDAPEAAFASAQQHSKIVFVDLWAPWCHTCLSMKEYVLRADKLDRSIDDYVFLSINTEKPENADFLRKIPLQAWPTFYALEGSLAQPQVRGRWVGAASPKQLVTFLRDSLHTAQTARAGSLRNDDPLALAAAGDRLFAEGKLEAAAEKYGEALARAPADWPRKPDILLAQISLLSKTKQPGPCADLGIAAMSQTGESASASDFWYHALDCAGELEPSDSRTVRLRKAAEQRLSALCDGTNAELTADDRADACATLREARETLGDSDGMKRAAEARLAVLEEATRGLPDDAALTYDWARAETLLWLDRGSEALTFLTVRERALEADYNPPHYLARVYKELGRHQEGLAAIERALGKAYGPRRAGILGVKVDLLLGANRKDEAKRVLDEQLSAYRALPDGQKQLARQAAVESRLSGWK